MKRTSSSQTQSDESVMDALASQGRVERFFVARESGTNSDVLMEGMISQTLTPHCDIAGVADVLKEGLGPLKRHTQFATHAIRKANMNAVVFIHEGSLYLYSMGSAASRNADGDNDFTTLLSELIAVFKPETIYVANFNRLVRSAAFAGELMSAVEQVGTKIDAGTMVLDLDTGPGRVLWQTLAMVADLERESINHRLFAGLVTKYRRGEWILAPTSVPPGYTLNNMKKVVLDPSQIRRVRLLIELLADNSLTDRQVIDICGEAGMTSGVIKNLHGPDATYLDVQNAYSLVRTLVDHVKALADGRYRVEIPSPYRSETQIDGLTMLPGDKKHKQGYVAFDYELPSPPEGWGDPALLRAAACRRTSRKSARAANRRRGRTPSQRRPLSGWSTTQDEFWEYKIASHSTYYSLLRREHGSERPWTNRDGSRGADRVATVTPEELHRAIVDAAQAALRQGVDLELLDDVTFSRVTDLAHIMDRGAFKLGALEEDRKDALARYNRARKNANAATDDEMADDFLQDAAKARQMIKRLDAQIADHLTPMNSVLPESFESDCDFVAHALAALAQDCCGGGHVLADQLSHIIEFISFSTDSESGPPTMTASFRLRLPTEQGVIALGPIECSVRNIAYSRTLGVEQIRSARQLLIDIHGQNASWSAVKQEAIKALLDKGYTTLAAKTLLRSDLISIYTVVAQEAWNVRPDDSIDKEFLALIRRIYQHPKFIWNGRKHSLDVSERQTLVDAVVAQGGHLSTAAASQALGTGRASQLAVAAYSRDAHNGRGPAWPATVQRSGHWGQGKPGTNERSVHVPPCNHCASLAMKVIRVPELPTTLLCTGCLRSTAPDSPIYPPEYLTL